MIWIWKERHNIAIRTRTLLCWCNIRYRTYCTVYYHLLTTLTIHALYTTCHKVSRIPVRLLDMYEGLCISTPRRTKIRFILMGYANTSMCKTAARHCLWFQMQVLGNEDIRRMSSVSPFTEIQLSSKVYDYI